MTSGQDVVSRSESVIAYYTPLLLGGGTLDIVRNRTAGQSGAAVNCDSKVGTVIALYNFIYL